MEDDTIYALTKGSNLEVWGFNGDFKLQRGSEPDQSLGLKGTRATLISLLVRSTPQQLQI